MQASRQPASVLADAWGWGGGRGLRAPHLAGWLASPFISRVSLDFLCFTLGLPLRGFLNPRIIWAQQGPRPSARPAAETGARPLDPGEVLEKGAEANFQPGH